MAASHTEKRREGGKEKENRGKMKGGLSGERGIIGNNETLH